MRTSNPALNDKIFQQAAQEEYGATTMTVGGTVNKTAILLMLVILTASIMWQRFVTVGSEAVMPWMFVGLIGGLIAGFATIFLRRYAMYTAPVYALFEGLLLGGLSVFMESVFPGIVIQAVGLTFGTLILILTIYKTGIIKVTDKFRLGVVAATGAIFLVYMATWIMSFFGAQIPYIHGSGPIGIGFSLVVIVIATLNLVLDFDFIERGAQLGAPKYMEWYGAFGLIVTLVWLYIEFLRLLSKLRSR